MENAGIAQSGIIDEEQFCIGCGYNLRTLHWGGRCPECGRAILDSLGKTLFSADRDWLNAVRFGMLLLALHVVTALGAAFAGRFVDWLLALYLLTPAGPKMALLLELAGHGHGAAALAILALVLYGAGILCFTQTGSVEIARSRDINEWLRWTGVISCGVGLLSIGAFLFQKRISNPWLLIMSGLVVEVLLIILTYERLAQLAELAQKPRLATLTRGMIALHMLAAMAVTMCFSADRIFALIVLGPLTLAGFIIWTIYFQLLSRAMRRS